MAFFDELGKVISDKSKEAANRVKDITGVLQLKSKLSAEIRLIRHISHWEKHTMTDMRASWKGNLQMSSTLSRQGL